MAEAGIDISRNKTSDVFDLLRQEKTFDYVITVCDDVSGEHCPLFPGRAERLHWSFADPVKLVGGPEERMKEIRLIREQIRQRIAWFIEERKIFLAALRDAQGEQRA
jgi:arsenate reductase